MPPSSTTKKRPEQQQDKCKKFTFKWCAETGEKIWYSTVTLADIRKAQSTGETPNSKKKQLVRIPSKHERQIRYDLAAEAIASRESQLLPTFGGRPWTISVKVTEPTTTTARQKPPLFRYFRGSLELAVLPHLLERIPQDGMATKGKAKHDEEGMELAVVSTALSERTASQISVMAWNDPEYMIPTVTTKWLSPNHKLFTSRKAAEEEAARLQADQLILDKLLFGVGARGQKLRPTKTTKNDALRAGNLRFLRDGIWVVGQEDAWQAERADQVELEEQKKAEAARRKAEEEAKLEEEKAAKPKPAPKKRHFSALSFFIFTKRNAHRHQRQLELDLKQPIEKVKFSLKDAETELKEAFALLKPRQRNQWKEKAREANLANTDIILSGLDYFVLMRRDELECRLKLAFKAAHVDEGKLDEAAYGQLSSFVSKDGEEKKEDTTATMVNRKSNVDEEGVGAEQPVFNSCTVLRKLRQQWDDLSDDCRAEWTRRAREYSNAEASKRKENEKIPPGLKGTTDCLTAEMSKAIDSVIALIVSKVEDEVSISYGVGSLVPIMTASPARIASSQNQEPAIVTSNSPAESVTSLSHLPAKRRRPFSKCPPRRFGVSDHWRLSQKHIELCYDAAMEHYEKVMYTVKARALFAELADGFDVLRERGRGRYDMELPAFESPAFSFLTSLEKAAWMPVVRAILGEEVTLIHKGVFLSMPGAEHQVYHQDGPHLNSKFQRPCHAVNVFIPLVDLNPRNGPTEFCLGSHILGFEDYDKANVYLPLVQAGTPIVFDYRLGHRGMANTGPACRPVVYCTYAASKDGKEFRDSVNFSTKRYHKIGNLIEKPISREERAKKRKLALEEKECIKLIQTAELFHDEIKVSGESNEGAVEFLTRFEYHQFVPPKAETFDTEIIESEAVKEIAVATLTAPEAALCDGEINESEESKEGPVAMVE